ncbi:glycosyltransferase family 2 protein [Petroclostridium xylanilyticum]|uniref:glycosyltransferase family 2 protein n=1 Tax=Petroclostridium xylanilyticum TaxID=1792311 RepID=UPI000B998C44|nr:glycosyltransferase family 2 protein [Petroclostridium xylanilyticum]
MNINDPLVSVIILTWNRKEDTLECIDSIYKQSYKNIEIIVVDNASTDGTPQAIKKTYPEVKLIHLPHNLGCPEGRNVGIVNSSGEILFFLDNDAIIEPHSLNKIVTRITAEEKLGIVQAKIIEDPSKFYVDISDKERYTHLFSGGASAFKKEVFDKVGLYPNDFFGQAEESDLALRALEYGYNILYFPQAIIFHKASHEQRNRKKIIKRQFFNDIRVAWKYYPIHIALLQTIGKTIIYIYDSLKNNNLFFVFDCVILINVIVQSLRKRTPVSKKTLLKRKQLKSNIRDR